VGPTAFWKISENLLENESDIEAMAMADQDDDDDEDDHEYHHHHYDVSDMSSDGEMESEGGDYDIENHPIDVQHLLAALMPGNVIITGLGLGNGQS
jgi:hypothetical protein